MLTKKHAVWPLCKGRNKCGPYGSYKITFYCHSSANTKHTPDWAIHNEIIFFLGFNWILETTPSSVKTIMECLVEAKARHFTESGWREPRLISACHVFLLNVTHHSLKKKKKTQNKKKRSLTETPSFSSHKHLQWDEKVVATETKQTIRVTKKSRLEPDN